jgi:hypothetical protein
MKFNLNNFSLSQLKWLLYPVIVVFFVVATQYWLWSGTVSFWNRIQLARDEVGQNVKTASILETKLQALQKVDIVGDTEKFKRLNTAVPANKDLTLVLTELQNVSNNTQISLSDFKSATGVLTFAVTYTTDSFEALNLLVAEIYKSLPILNVNNITYAPGRASMELSGIFSPFVDVKASLESPLPEYQQMSAEAVNALEGYNEIATVAEITPVLPLSSSPF